MFVDRKRSASGQPRRFFTPRGRGSSTSTSGDKAGYSYPIFWNACKLLTRGASATERADFLLELRLVTAAR